VFVALGPQVPEKSPYKVQFFGLESVGVYWNVTEPELCHVLFAGLSKLTTGAVLSTVIVKLELLNPQLGVVALSHT